MERKHVQRMALCLLVLPCSVLAFQGEQLKVKVTVRGGCTTTGSEEIHFGQIQAGHTGNHGPVNGAVHYWCSQGVQHSINADQGQHYASGSNHMMRLNGTETIPYTLSVSPESAVGQGPTPPAQASIQATIPANGLANASEGDYEDTVTVTVEP